MRTAVIGIASLTLAALAAAESATSPPRLIRAQLGPAPYGVQSGGIAACDVTLDARGAVVGAELVQDAPPYGTLLRDAVGSWGFDPATANGRPVGARVLVLGLFRPPALSIQAPERPAYESTRAPAEIPWPASVAVPPNPANVVGSGTVFVEADVADRGTVVSARALGSASAFDSAALDATRQWVFRPAARDGRPVASRVFLIFSFVGVTP
jgi:TonB family protein